MTSRASSIFLPRPAGLAVASHSGASPRPTPTVGKNRLPERVSRVAPGADGVAEGQNDRVAELEATRGPRDDGEQGHRFEGRVAGNDAVGVPDRSMEESAGVEPAAEIVDRVEGKAACSSPTPMRTAKPFPGGEKRQPVSSSLR